jgi:hypothetical protein
MRGDLTETNHKAFAVAKAKNDLNIFLRAMAPLTARYDREHSRRALTTRLLATIKRHCSRVRAARA